MQQDFGEVVEAAFGEIIERARGSTFTPWTVLLNRSLQRVSAFAQAQPWAAYVVESLWQVAGKREDHRLTLADLNTVAVVSGRSTDEAFTVLSILTGDEPGQLAMCFEQGDSGVPVSREEIFRQLRAWWTDKTMKTEQWHGWASSVKVSWAPVLMEKRA